MKMITDNLLKRSSVTNHIHTHTHTHTDRNKRAVLAVRRKVGNTKHYPGTVGSIERLFTPK